MAKNKMDLTQGSVLKNLLLFAIPIVLTNILQQLYHAADMIVVGNFAQDSTASLAAVGFTNSITALCLNLFVGLAIGAGVTVAHALGAKEDSAVHRAIHTLMPTALVSGILLTVVGVSFSGTFLRWMGTPDTVLPLSSLYMKIYFAGITFTMVYNFAASILRAVGDTKSPLIFLTIAGVINVVMNLIFVTVFHMNVAGVALATIIAQGISAVCCYAKLMKLRHMFDLNKDAFRFDKHISGRIIRIGIPSGITQAIMSCSMMIVQALTNSMGEMVIAANVIIMRVDGFAMMPNFSFGTALTTYAGQNVGAGLYDRVTKGAKQGLAMAVGCSAGITALILFFGKHLMHLFTETQDLVDLSYRLMMILAVGYIAMAVTQSLSGIMRGAGDTMTPMWISLITTVAIRVPVAYGIAWLTSPTGNPADGMKECIQISLLASWCIGAILTAIFYKMGHWKKKRIKQ